MYIKNGGRYVKAVGTGGKIFWTSEKAEALWSANPVYVNSVIAEVKKQYGDTSPEYVGLGIVTKR